jgi:hypothetical protein
MLPFSMVNVPAFAPTFQLARLFPSNKETQPGCCLVADNNNKQKDKQQK